MPLAGALAFELDGVFVGATWTRDMRNAMVISLAVYLASFFLAAVWQWRALGRLDSLFSLAWSQPSMALSKIILRKSSARPIRRRHAGCVREPRIGFLRQKTKKTALDFLRK